MERRLMRRDLSEPTFFGVVVCFCLFGLVFIT